MSNVKNFVKLHREAVLFVLIFTLAALVRLVMFCDHPALLMLSIWALLKSTEKPRFFIIAAVILSLSL